ncbi:MAG TPA: NADH-quinone oxidoreductase subunit J [Puia sp.]
MLTIFIILRFITEVLALGVLLTSNLVHAILFLIAMFLNVSIMLFCIGCSYLAIVIPMVYVGAILISFLFVVMMLDMDLTVREDFKVNHVPFTMSLLFICLVEIAGVFEVRNVNSYVTEISSIDPIVTLAHFIYGFDTYTFFVAGLMLFMAMTGIIASVNKNHAQ